MNELFLYDRDDGLFKAIINQSTVMQGRYFVSTSGGSDLNTNNLEQYLSDALHGIKTPDQKYPCVLCTAPRSVLSERFTEIFQFQLYFLCKTFVTGQNGIKSLNENQQVSEHHIWYSWKDMKECAVNFRFVLNQIIRKKLIDTDPITKYFSLLNETGAIDRLSRFSNDDVSGVRLSFRIELNLECEIQDYALNVIDLVEIPDVDIHPLHKH